MLSSDERMKRRGRRVYVARHIIATVMECYALAELVYYYTHDGNTLYGVGARKLATFVDRSRERAIFRRKLNEIRALPETGNGSNSSND